MNKIQAEPNIHRVHAENGEGYLTYSDLDNKRTTTSQTRRENEFKLWDMRLICSGNLDDSYAISCLWMGRWFYDAKYIDKSKQWIPKKKTEKYRYKIAFIAFLKESISAC